MLWSSSFSNGTITPALDGSASSSVICELSILDSISSTNIALKPISISLSEYWQATSSCAEVEKSISCADISILLFVSLNTMSPVP